MKRALVPCLLLTLVACHHEPGAMMGEPDLAEITADLALPDNADLATSSDLKKPSPCKNVDCGAHGSCVGTKTATCECEDGWTGAACSDCDTAHGWVSNGAGGCQHDPCMPNPCTPNRPICVVVSGAAQCNCEAGKHLEGDACLDDTTCMPTTCSGHGDCADGGGSVACTCTMGYIGQFCGACASGYHDDGTGGCTNQPCIPNPCTAPHRSACSSPDGLAPICDCESGYHLDGIDCVVDETCAPDSCSGHGVCSVELGKVHCACGDGFTGPTCSTCADGYHSDGAGSCTTDPCTPSPCSVPHKSVCTPVDTTTATCGCDDGYHSDGADGCTTDPCTPNLCAAQNQACQVVDGKAQCYTPPCDDMNPCTTDTIVDGVCQHLNLADTTVCSTTLCVVGQTCKAGVCQGGSARVCNDGNACTRNECDAVMGCAYPKDDTLVPDDGKDCTVDKCANGVASHNADSSVCKDDLWCNGTETCAPADPSADARGCIHSAVPKPPALGQNSCSHYVCDETSDAFTLVKAAPSTPCNDGLPCTTGDTCQSDGACRGSVVQSCALSCSGAAPLPGTIDLPTARLSGTVTLGGGDLKDSAGGGSIYLYLVDQRTGARVSLHTIDFDYGSPYKVVAADKTYATVVLPGVYDLLYERGVSTTKPVYTYHADAGENYPYAFTYLRRNVVVGPGANTLDIDIPSTKLTGAVQLNHGALTNSVGGSSVYFYLVDPVTGAHHPIHTVDFDYGSPYKVVAADASYATVVMPGTYDLLYERGVSTTKPITTYHADPTETYPYAVRYLQRNVVIPPGSTTLALDIPATPLSGQLKLNGGALADSVGGGSIYLYLVDQATGSRAPIHTVDFNYGSPYKVVAADASYTTLVMPGTYDLLYERGISTSNPLTTYHGDATENYAYGVQYLKRNIVIPPSQSGVDPPTLDINLPSAKLSGNVTLNGGALTDSTGGGSIYLYLVDQNTGSRAPIHTIDFNYGTPYKVVASDKSYATTILPGTYDLLYERGISTSNPIVTYHGTIDEAYPYGYQYLQRNIVVGPGATALDIDLPARKLTGSVTLNGGNLLDSVGGGSIYLYLVDQTTGARAALHTIDFNYGSPYKVDTADKTFTTVVLPGTYDLLYERGVSTTKPLTTYRGDPSESYAYAVTYLQRNIVIAPDAAAPFKLDINLTSTKATGMITLNGGPLTDSPGGGSIYLYLYDRGTQALEPIHTIDFDYGWPYKVVASDKSFSVTVQPGQYDLLYERGISTTNPIYTYHADPNETYAYSYSFLGACYTTP